MLIKQMLSIVPMRAWIALGVIWVGQVLVMGFVGAALYHLVF